MGTFRSTKKSGWNIRQLPGAKRTVFSKISKKEDYLARYTQIFQFFSFPEVLLKFSLLLPECLEFSVVEWFDFEINISDKKSRRFDLSEVIFKCIKVL